MDASVPSSNPASTALEASAMAVRVRVMSTSIRSAGAQISTASWTGGADLDPALGSQAAGDSQHLGAVGLHGEVAQRAGIRPLADPDMPAEHGVKRTAQHGVVDRSVGPGPEPAGCLSVGAAGGTETHAGGVG